MLSLLAATLFWFPSLVGWGTLLPRLLRRLNVSTTSHYGPGDLGLFGIAILIWLAMMVNFFAPIGIEVSVAALVIGWGLVFWRPAELWAKFSAPEAAVFVVLILVHAYVAAVAPLNFDTGYYHLPAVTWVRMSSAVLGLANVNPWIGHNSSLFPFEAMLYLPELKFAAVFAAGTLVSSFFYLVLFGELYRRARQGSALTFLTVFATVAFLMNRQLVPDVGLIRPDIFARLFVLYAWLQILKLNEASRTEVPRFVVALLFLVAAASVKLFVGGIVAGSVGLLLVLAYRREGRGLTLKLIGYLAILIVIYATPWLGRGVLTSGALFFPSPTSLFSGLSWAVPREQAANIYLSLRSFYSAVDENGKMTLAIVLRNVSVLLSSPLLRATALLAAFAIFFSACRRRVFSDGQVKFGWLCFLAQAMGYGYCALLVPGAQFITWITVCTISTGVALLLMGTKMVRPLSVRGVYILFAIVTLLVCRMGYRTRDPNASIWRWDKIPQFVTGITTLPSGLPFHVPKPPDRSCWTLEGMCFESKQNGLDAEVLSGGRYRIFVRATAH